MASALLDHIRKLPHGRTNLKHLHKEQAHHGVTRGKLEAELAALVAHGDLVETRPGHYTAVGSTREFATGRMNAPGSPGFMTVS